jgi:hypothetical protein
MAKRIFQGVVLFFALYAFVFLPLGKKSALEHIRAIWATPAAQQAASEVKGGVTRLVRRLESEARKSSGDTERAPPPGDEQHEPKAPTGRKMAERRTAERRAAERTPAEGQTSERETAAGDPRERDLVVVAEEADAPRSTRKPRLRALSAETPARDGL